MRLTPHEIKVTGKQGANGSKKPAGDQPADEASALDLAAEKAWKSRQVTSFVKQSNQIQKGVRSVTTATQAAEEVSLDPGTLAKGYGKGVAGIGMVAGGLLAAQGVESIAEGKVKEGLGDVTTGGLAGAAGVAALKGAKSAGVLGVGATIAGGVSQIVNAQDAEDTAVGSAKTAGGVLFAAGLAARGTLIGAPASVLLNAAGATLVAGATVFENRAGLKKLGEKALGALRQATEAVAELGSEPKAPKPKP